MAITTAMANSYKQELLGMALHTSADVFKIALIKVGHTGTYSAATANAGTPGTGAPTTGNLGTDEVTGTGYTAGGTTLSGLSATLQGTTGVLDFASATWPSASISAVGAVVYNSSKANRVLGVFDFGGTVTSTGATFTAAAPAVGAATSLLRVA
jgi:hypothetical protein